jgi:hypothetical protein
MNTPNPFSSSELQSKISDVVIGFWERTKLLSLQTEDLMGMVCCKWDTLQVPGRIHGLHRCLFIVTPEFKKGILNLKLYTCPMKQEEDVEEHK